MHPLSLGSVSTMSDGPSAMRSSSSAVNESASTLRMRSDSSLPAMTAILDSALRFLPEMERGTE